MKQLLKDRTAIVTGSGQGTGKCIALCLAEYGCKVITNNRKKGSSIQAFEWSPLPFTEEERRELEAANGDAESTASAIKQMGGEAIPVYGDISDSHTAAELVHTALDAWGRIDIIVNNASSNWKGNFSDMDSKTWEISIRSKLFGTYYLMHYALPYMKSQRYGRILNAASDAFVGISEYAAYSAANAGVVALTKAVAQELSSSGITVNAYAPLARTRSWYNAKTSYRLQGIEPKTVEAFAPESMKHTAEGMVPFLAWLASPRGSDISGKLFKLASDGTIGLWSDSTVVREIHAPNRSWDAASLDRVDWPSFLSPTES